MLQQRSETQCSVIRQNESPVQSRQVLRESVPDRTSDPLSSISAWDPDQISPKFWITTQAPKHSWFLYRMVAQNTMCTCRVKSL